MVKTCLEINGRRIGSGYPVYIVAEMSANHNHNFDTAIKIIEAAKEAGADAVKLQTYRPDTITINCDSEYFRITKGTIWEGRNLYDLYNEAYTPWDWQPRLKEIADELCLDLFSTPFDETAVDFLEDMGVPAYKIASFELVDTALVRYIAEKGKPVIASTGMADLEEIDLAVRTIRETGNKTLALLKCVSAYPARPEEMNLKTIPHLSKAFQLPVGLSDHTQSIGVPVVAVALGAVVIEKHLTLDRQQGGPDADFSLEPQEFKEMVSAVRIAEKALGTVRYAVTEKEQQSRVFRRSLFVIADVKTGDMVTSDNVRSIRPGYGLPPRYLNICLGRVFKRNVSRGTPLDWSMI